MRSYSLLSQSRDNSVLLVTQIQRQSTGSQGSHVLSSSNEFQPNVLTDEELVQQVNKKKRQLQILKLENEVLERTIIRLDPSLMQGVYQALEYASKKRSSSGGVIGGYAKSITSRYGGELSCASRLFTASSRILPWKAESSAKLGGSLISSGGRRINVNERLELVTIEMQMVSAHKQQTFDKIKKKQDLYTAYFEEIDIRINEIEKTREEFTQKVIKEGYDRITQRIPAEIWVRHMTEFVKNSDKQISKMRLRATTLNHQYFKMKALIKDKADLAANLVPVDFEQIKIENSKCEKKIEEQLGALHGLKQLTGEANLLISIHKKVMYAQDAYLTKVKGLIKKRERETEQLDKENECMQAEAQMYSNQLEEVRNVRNKYRVPDIMEYVRIKNIEWNLKDRIKMLESRAHIQRIALLSTGLKMRKIAKNRSESSGVSENPFSMTPFQRESEDDKLPLLSIASKESSFTFTFKKLTKD